MLKFIPYPQLEQIQNQTYSVKILDNENEIIQITSVDGIHREYTPINKIPEITRQIFINAEDKRFYSHHGVDYFAAVSALFQNITSGHTVRGASTITMQLVRIMNPNQKRTFGRKLLDVINAYRIESKLSKDEILELYLNNVPFGQKTEGITSAARSFYNLELVDLSPEQNCCLAVIPRRPNLYNPAINPDECAKKAFLIASSTNLATTDLKIKEAADSARLYEYPFFMPHFVEYLKNQSDWGHSPVITTINLQAQFSAEQILSTAMSMTNDARIANASLLLLDNQTGTVLAWIGNYNFYDAEHSGQIDGVLVENQPGSSMKPFLYALALDTENGKYPKYKPNQILADIPTEFGNEQLYIPSNFNNRFNGPVRFRIALASSLNVPAVSILNDIGVPAYLDKLYELGFESLKRNGKKADLGLALGAGEVSLFELVPAFSTFVRDGQYIPLSVLPESSSSPKQIYSKDTSRIIASILSDKSARALGFGYSQTFETDYPAIFKTGTSNQYQSIVALGATKKYTVGVWMGNFQGQTIVGKTGSSLPAWAAKNLLDYLEGNPSTTKDNSKEAFFPEPENYHLEKVCPLSGKAPSKNCPTSVYEYIENQTENEICDWHTKENGIIQINLPAQYQQWVRINKQQANINNSSQPLQLISPKNNSIFYYSNLNSEKQAITIELIGGSSDYLIFEYDNKVMEVSRPFIVKLPLEQGLHFCRAINNSDQIEFSFTVK